MIALHNAAAQRIAISGRLSSTGYSGETFDAASQQQYLRARYYNPVNGRFNRLDPFVGNNSDPQSLHKYAYVHGDPVQGTDPSGMFFATLAVTAISVAARSKELGFFAATSVALYGALGASVGAFGYLLAGKSPFTGAYNGALIGSGLRIAYLIGGWDSVVTVMIDSIGDAVGRYLSESLWSYLTTPNPDHEKIADKSFWKSMDQLASSIWRNSIPDFKFKGKIGSFFDDPYVKMTLKSIDAASNSIISDLSKSPRPDDQDILENAAASVGVAIINQLIADLISTGDHAEQLQNASPEVLGQIMDQVVKLPFVLIASFDLKAFGSVLEIIREAGNA